VEAAGREMGEAEREFTPGWIHRTGTGEAAGREMGEAEERE